MNNGSRKNNSDLTISVIAIRQGDHPSAVGQNVVQVDLTTTTDGGQPPDGASCRRIHAPGGHAAQQ